MTKEKTVGFAGRTWFNRRIAIGKWYVLGPGGFHYASGVSLSLPKGSYLTVQFHNLPKD